MLRNLLDDAPENSPGCLLQNLNRTLLIISLFFISNTNFRNKHATLSVACNSLKNVTRFIMFSLRENQ
jgi:hypothetical protein